MITASPDMLTIKTIDRQDLLGDLLHVSRAITANVVENPSVRISAAQRAELFGDRHDRVRYEAGETDHGNAD